jgi:hypothetical protein
MKCVLVNHAVVVSPMIILHTLISRLYLDVL